MKTLTYVFWRIFKRLKYKDNSAFPYFNAVFYLGVVLGVIICIKWDLLVTKTKIEKYIILAFVSIICTLPIQFIFPKQKIEILQYTTEEEKKHKMNILKFVIGIVILAVLRLLYVKFI